MMQYGNKFKSISPLLKTLTPKRINGWNLQFHPIKRKENHLNQTSMRTCSTLIFRVVLLMEEILHHLRLVVYTHYVQILWHPRWWLVGFLNHQNSTKLSSQDVTLCLWLRVPTNNALGKALALGVGLASCPLSHLKWRRNSISATVHPF